MVSAISADFDPCQCIVLAAVADLYQGATLLGITHHPLVGSAESLGEKEELVRTARRVTMFTATTKWLPSVILAAVLIIAPVAHFVFSATGFSGSVTVSRNLPDGHSLTSLCGHPSHSGKYNVSCSAGIVVATSVSVMPARGLPRADAYASPVPRPLPAATARGPPTA